MTRMKPRPILIATDYSPSSDIALLRGFEQAASSLAAPHVVFVASSVQALPPGMMAATPPVPPAVQELQEELGRHVDEQRRDFEKRSGGADMQRPVVHVRTGAPADEICRLAREIDAGTIVVGTHGRRGVRRALMGSVAEVVVRKAPCPVLVVRSQDDGVLGEDALPEDAGGSLRGSPSP